MPLPQDDTLPQGERAGASSSTTVDGADTETIIEKFQQLGEDAAVEEDEDDDEDGDDVGADGGAPVTGEGSAEGAGGEGKKKKKKKKKGKASKAVDKLKLVPPYQTTIKWNMRRTLTDPQDNRYRRCTARASGYDQTKHGLTGSGCNRW